MLSRDSPIPQPSFPAPRSHLPSPPHTSNNYLSPAPTSQILISANYRVVNGPSRAVFSREQVLFSRDIINTGFVVHAFGLHEPGTACQGAKFSELYPLCHQTQAWRKELGQPQMTSLGKSSIHQAPGGGSMQLPGDPQAHTSPCPPASPGPARTHPRYHQAPGLVTKAG